MTEGRRKSLKEIAKLKGQVLSPRRQTTIKAFDFKKLFFSSFTHIF